MGHTSWLWRLQVHPVHKGVDIMSVVKDNMACMAMIEDATKRIGDRLVPLLLSGELSISDEYVNKQMSIITDMINRISTGASSEL